MKIRDDLLKAKDVIRKPAKSRPYSEEVDQVVLQLKSLDEKIEEIKSFLMSKKESPVKLKRKKEIIFILKKNGKITASELSRTLRISRSRSNEYLKELERQGIAEGFAVGKEKFYRVKE
ncbi:MAG: winged helix-turn-helix domain-containing protein [Candidatus Aenigmarchaeota archaeon]|nr:winged helix-turn-helix domain-containing protein [Candidatus Aenigmarchaeota archaeon]